MLLPHNQSIKNSSYLTRHMIIKELAIISAFITYYLTGMSGLATGPNDKRTFSEDF